MFRASLCPSSGDRLYKTASGVSLDVLAADCVESGHELSALCECRYSIPAFTQCPQLVSGLQIQANTRRGFIQSVS